MSSEVCPFCGKTYKRLKSHLPHCKAAASAKTPPTRHDVTMNEITTSSQLAAAPTKPAAKGGKSTRMLSVTESPQSKKSKKVSAVSSAQLQSSSPATYSQSANTSSSSQSSFLSSASLTPSSKKKKKQQLSEQIETVIRPSSTNDSLISSQSQTPYLSPTVSKPKKKSLRDLIEASKSKQISKGSTEGTRSALEDLPSGSTPLVADPLSPRTTAPTETQTTPDKDVNNNTHPAFVSTETKTKGATASKMNVLKKKKTEKSPLLTKDTPSSLDSQVNESSAKQDARDDFLVENTGEIEDLSVNKMLLKSGNGHQARITLQDVKATLGRAKSVRQSSRSSILSQIGTNTDLRSKFRPGTSVSLVPLQIGNQEDVDSCLVTTKTLSDQLPSISAQHTELQSVKKKSSKTKNTSLIPLQHDASPQPELTSLTTSLLSGPLTSQVIQAKSLPQTVSMNESLKVGRHMTKLPAISTSLNHFSSPQHFLLVPQTLPPSMQTLRADDGLRMEESQLEVKKQNTADTGSKGAPAQRGLGQVRLRELPEWLVCRTPSRPRDLVEMVQRGWQWYYKKYIDVKKGGVGGLGMLFVGYCVLSYMWSYPHIKLDRWRKHH